MFRNFGMKKFEYIKTAQDSANQRIWDFISLRYQSIARKNVVLGVLWIVAACVVFGCIAVIGWLSSFLRFFKDLRFTPHYLRTVISSLRMTEAQTRAFLDAAVWDYKKRLSFGSFSVKEQKRIETMFEVLYQEFVSGDNDTVGNLETLTQAVEDGNSELRTIANYASWKHTAEIEEVERKQNLQDQQTQRSKAAHNREKGRMLDTFEHVLTDIQIDMIAECCNDICAFTRDIETQELRDILECTHSEPLQMSLNKYIAVIFDKLWEHKLICKTWKSVADRQKCFTSKQGKPITSKDLSTALSNAYLIKQDIDDKINDCIRKVVNSE